MSSFELLNNEDHYNVRVITERNAQLGDAVSAAPIFPTEFADVIAEYPIFFRETEDNLSFETIALLGFKSGENLFLKNGVWDASFIPSYIDRGPFMIGFQKQFDEGTETKKPVIHIDMSNPRIREGGSEGEPIFLEHGGNSPFLEKINEKLSRIYTGIEAGNEMIQTFVNYDLIEPIQLDLTLNDGTTHKLIGYYTIHEERLNKLDKESVYDLYKKGFLQGAYFVTASLVNVKKLLQRKNEQLFT